MRIGIDATPLTIPFPCGQKHYMANLIKALAKIDKVNLYIILSPKNVPIPNQENFKLVVFPKIPIFKRQILIPFFAWRNRVDVFHNPDVIGSIFYKFPRIVTTIHDLAPDSSYPNLLESPKYFLMKSYQNLIKKFTIRNSAHLITVSKNIKGEITKSLNIKIPVSVINEGVSNDFKINSKLKDENYILAMADFSPRKNILRTLVSFSIARRKISKKIKLRVVVSTSYPIKKIETKSTELGIQKSVVIEKNVTQKRLMRLYNQAIVFVYPSLYEGFGLPILEAMVCGCPVITSSYGAMRETAGHAAYLINPKSVKEISTAITRLTNSKDLRENLIHLGLRRVNKFSWEKTAKETLKVYKKLYLSHTPHK